jgi:hypothetical protein
LGVHLPEFVLGGTLDFTAARQPAHVDPIGTPTAFRRIRIGPLKCTIKQYQTWHNLILPQQEIRK